MYELCLSLDDVRDVMGIINAGKKALPPRGYEMKRGMHVVRRMEIFLRGHGKDDLKEDI